MNEDSLTFKVKPQKYFENDTLKEVSNMLNIKFTSQKTQPTCDTKAIDEVKVTDSFNFYKENSSCRHEFELDKSASSYAQAPMSVYRNRYCLRKLGDDFFPSL